MLGLYYFKADWVLLKVLEISSPSLNLLFAKLSSVNQG